MFLKDLQLKVLLKHSFLNENVYTYMYIFFHNMEKWTKKNPPIFHTLFFLLVGTIKVS